MMEDSKMTQRQITAGMRFAITCQLLRPTWPFAYPQDVASYSKISQSPIFAQE